MSKDICPECKGLGMVPATTIKNWPIVRLLGDTCKPCNGTGSIESQPKPDPAPPAQNIDMDSLALLAEGEGLGTLENAIQAQDNIINGGIER